MHLTALILGLVVGYNFGQAKVKAQSDLSTFPVSQSGLENDIWPIDDLGQNKAKHLRN